MLDVCRRNGISQVVFSPLAQGVLTGKYRPGEPPPADSRAASDEMNTFIGRLVQDDTLEAVQRLQPIADGAGLTLPQLALAWILREDNVASAIIGASRPEQVARERRRGRDRAHARRARRDRRGARRRGGALTHHGIGRELIADRRAASPRVGELWEQRPAAVRSAGRKTFAHPAVGRVTVDCDVLFVHGTDLRVMVYTAEPGSADADALALIGVVGLQDLEARSARNADAGARALEQAGELGRRLVVEREQRRPDRPRGVADERAAPLHGGRVALRLEEAAQRPQAGPQLARGGEVDVVDQQPVQRARTARARSTPCPTRPRARRPRARRRSGCPSR